MLISVLGFGSIWTRRAGARGGDAAYYNTTGVSVNDRVRHRPRVYGVARFNGRSGFHPDCMYRMIHKVFECESPCVWAGRNKVLFKSLLPRPEKPDAYLVVVTLEQTGGVETDQGGTWLHPGAQVISFSECREAQEVMLVMPPFSWLRGRLGTFFIEPETPRQWQARLVLSATV